MFEQTDTEIAPWKVIRANRKTEARITAAKHILDTIPYVDEGDGCDDIADMEL